MDSFAIVDFVWKMELLTSGMKEVFYVLLEVKAIQQVQWWFRFWKDQIEDAVTQRSTRVSENVVLPFLCL